MPAFPPHSGAVGVGCQRLRLAVRPDSLAQKQALAAVGQVHLMRYYDDLFTAVDMVRHGLAGGRRRTWRRCGRRMRIAASVSWLRGCAGPRACRRAATPGVR